MKKLTFILLVFFIGRTVYSQSLYNLITEINVLIDKNEAKAFHLIDSLIQVEDKSEYIYIEDRILYVIPNFDDYLLEFYTSRLLQDSLFYDYYVKVGSHFFNLGTEILKTETNPPLLNNIETGKLYFERAFPFILQAYKMNPDNVEIYEKLLVLFHRLDLIEFYEELKKKKPNV